jgi:arabinan endo-1,5-alpha-L-arabinosidase
MVSRAKSVAPTLEEFEGRLLLAASGRSKQAPAPPPPMTTPAPSAAPEPAPSPAPADSDPGQVTGVTDPRVIQEGNTFYLFSTGPGIPIRTSTDLTHWQTAGQVFAATPNWALAQVPGATSIWAPDVSYFNGLYHLYYAVSTFGGQRSVIGLATNTTLDPSAPGYHWVDQGEVIESSPGLTNYNAIDPNIVIDPLTGVWLAFGSQWSGIKLVAIDPATGKPEGRHPRPHPLASRPGSAPIEAPFIFQRDGYYYLFVSFDVCCMGVNSTYRIMVGRSTSVTGPYLDQRGRPMTRGGGTQVLAGNARDRGPGHNAVLAVGGTDYLVYHTYDALNDGTPTLQIRPLLWTPDGWPVVAAPLF